MKKIFWFKIYNEELEKQQKFQFLTDFCDSFHLNRGKNVSEEENEIVGEFKVIFILMMIDICFKMMTFFREC